MSPNDAQNLPRGAQSQLWVHPPIKGGQLQTVAARGRISLERPPAGLPVDSLKVLLHGWRCVYFSAVHSEMLQGRRGAGQPFLFSHGLSGNCQRAIELAAGLPGLRLIVYDNRGHGRTPIGDAEKLNFASMSDDAVALLDHLSIPKAVVGGVSMGAGIALSCAVRHPDRVRALILNRPAWLDQPYPPNLRFAAVLADLVESFGPAAAWRQFEDTDAWRDLHGISPGMLDSLRDTVLHWSPEALVTCYRRIPASTPMDSLQAIADLDVPALVTASHNDPVHPFEMGEVLAYTLPGGRLREIPSRVQDLAGHVREFRTAVTEFLAEIG